MQEFAVHLRLNGINVALPETLTALEALNVLDQPPTYKLAKKILKSIFTSDRNTWDSFDYLCDVYWLGLRDIKTEINTGSFSISENEYTNNHNKNEDFKNANSKLDLNKAFKEIEAATSSEGHEVDSNLLRDEANNEKIIELAKKLARTIKSKKSSRYKLGRRGKLVDFRHSFQKSLATDGEVLKLLYKIKKPSKMKISAFLDVSGSMKNYIGFYLNFLKGVTLGGWKPEAFIFHTKLQRITKIFQEHDEKIAIDKLNSHAYSFGGGTRIANSLLTFYQRFGKACLGKRSMVVIISDGFDADSPEELIKSLKLIRSQTKCIFWLSPTLEEVNSKNPKSRSLRLAQEYIDMIFLIKSISDLERLVNEFQKQVIIR